MSVIVTITLHVIQLNKEDHGEAVDSAFYPSETSLGLQSRP